MHANFQRKREDINKVKKLLKNPSVVNNIIEPPNKKSS